MFHEGKDCLKIVTSYKKSLQAQGYLVDFIEANPNCLKAFIYPTLQY